MGQKISFAKLSLFGILFFIALSLSSRGRGADTFIDWSDLKNPLLELPDRAVKDQCVVYHDGWFYFFVSNRFEDNRAETFQREMRFYRSRDLRTFEPFFDQDLITQYKGQPAFPESPDVTLISGTWYMVFQSRIIGRERYRLCYSTSQDLLDWSPAKEIAPANKPKERQIDGALAFQDGYFYLGYKGEQKFYVTRSQGPSLDGNWLPAQRAGAGGRWAENFQFLSIDGSWRLIATAMYPVNRRDFGFTRGHEAFIYTMSGRGSDIADWTQWTDMTHLEIKAEDWNQVMLDNSAYLCDWRDHDGYFYLFYAGSNDDVLFQGQSHCKIGVARSKDLVHWHLPPQ